MGEVAPKPAALSLALDLLKDHMGSLPMVRPLAMSRARTAAPDAPALQTVAKCLLNGGRQTLVELTRSTVCPAAAPTANCAAEPLFRCRDSPRSRRR